MHCVGAEVCWRSCPEAAAHVSELRSCGAHLVHGPCWDHHRVPQELDHGPALNPVLVQEPLALLPAQVKTLVSDWVLVQGDVQSLFLTKLGWGGSERIRDLLCYKNGSYQT